MSVCHIEADFIVSSGVLVGSLENSVSVKMKQSSVFFYGFGRSISAIGSVKGKKAEIYTNRIGAEFNVTADVSTLLGALDGASDIKAVDSALKFETTGKQALLFGGNSTATTVELLNSDTQAVVHSAIGKDTMAPDENIRIINGRRKITINGEEVERPIVYDYT